METNNMNLEEARGRAWIDQLYKNQDKKGNGRTLKEISANASDYWQKGTES